MGFLKPKVVAPPPPPPPPPDPVVKPADVVSTEASKMREKLKDPKRVSRKKTIATSARGVTQDAPLEYASLMGSSRASNTNTG
jgi:hypothetical protein